MSSSTLTPAQGFEATRKLRSQGCTVPIIALTAAATLEVRNQCLEAGMQRYMTKPSTSCLLISWNHLSHRRVVDADTILLEIARLPPFSGLIAPEQAPAWVRRC